MRVAVTGAGGFIGRYVVEHIAASGHEVIAILRSPPAAAWVENNAVTVVQADLSDQVRVREALNGCDCVIHLAADMAASTSGREKTLTATRNLLQAMSGSEPQYLLLVSSIAVLNYSNLLPNSQITEHTDVASEGDALGQYAEMKLAQERICYAWAENELNHLAIVRPGIVYDDYILSTAHAGLTFKGLAFVPMHDGEVPVVHAEDLASALLLAATQPVSDEVFHIVGDALPKQNEYVEELKRRNILRFVLPLNWQLFALLAGIARTMTGGERSRMLPDTLRRSSFEARMTPYDFSSEKARKRLAWQPRYTRRFYSGPVEQTKEQLRCD